MFYHHLQQLKAELAGKEKGVELHRCDIREPQEYLKKGSLAEARIAFRVQNRMLDIPADMPGRYRGRMRCRCCLAWRVERKEEEAPVLDREHIEVCPGLATLREGRELHNKREHTLYFMDVMKVLSVK